MANNVGPLMAPNNLADVNSKPTSRFNLSLPTYVADRTAMAALSGATDPVVFMDGYDWIFTTGNQSAVVTADPLKGLCVPPATDLTGASGAYIRQFQEDVSASWFGTSAAASAATNTAAINAAITASALFGAQVLLPAYKMDINAGVGGGIVVINGLRLKGQGYFKTILNLTGGGSITQLRNYQAGSGIRRAFNYPGVNDYVQDVIIENLAVVMNHPLAAVTTTAIQIGVDFRNITRSEVRNCWIGNYDPILDDKGGTRPYLCQGYGFVTGNESGDPSYAGGEVNTLRRSFVPGAYHSIAIDDNLLSPVSAAYSTRILENDIQVGQVLIYQANQYGAANVFENNVLQALESRFADVGGNYGIYVAGYGNIIDEPYGEYGLLVTAILQFAGSAKRNRARYSSTCSVTSGLVVVGPTSMYGFLDAAGALGYNYVEFFASTTTAGGFDSLGSPQRMISQVSTTQT